MIISSKLATVVQRNVHQLSSAYLAGLSAAYRWTSTRLRLGGATWKQRLRAVLVERRRESSQR
jgi:hypothetical protein